MEHIEHLEPRAHMNRKQEYENQRDYARVLFIRDRLTLDEISEKTGLHRTTVGNWSADGGWKKLQRNFQLTREEQVANLLDELVELNTSIREKPKGMRFADDKQGNVRRKLVRDIKDLETRLSPNDIIDHCTPLVHFIMQIDRVKGRELALLIDKYVESHVNAAGA